MSDTGKFCLKPHSSLVEKNVWTEYVKLAEEYKAVDLAIGCPDFLPPKFITDCLMGAIHKNDPSLHQYTRGYGHPRLVNVIAQVYSKLLDKEVNCQNEVLVTSGATEALFCAITGHVTAGDEVIIIEPFFDVYEPDVRIAGGTPVYIPLIYKKTSESPPKSSDWKLDPDKLEKCFNSKTKAIILNTPHNPLGKVFNKEELSIIARLCIKWNVLCIADEVYEWLVFEPNKHIRIASLPGMWERTITIGSAGKTFCVTGWKIGWAYGPQNLLQNLNAIHTSCNYSCSTLQQEAVATGLESELKMLGTETSFLTKLAQDLKIKRDYLADLLTQIGMQPVLPDGGYFLIADWSPLESLVNLESDKSICKDERFNLWLTKTVGVQAIPPSAFFSEGHTDVAKNYIRFCIIKSKEKLEEAAEQLLKWKRLTLTTVSDGNPP